MAATWNKIDPVEVTFTVRFTEKSEGGLLKFEDTEGSVPGYTLRYGYRGAYFTGPKEVPSTLDALFEGLRPDQKAQIAAILTGTAPPVQKGRKPKA